MYCKTLLLPLGKGKFRDRFWMVVRVLLNV